MKAVIELLKKVAKGLIQVYYNLTGHGNLPVFIVLASARTGSNYFTSLLNSHQNIQVYAEIYAKLLGSTEEEIWKRLVSSHKPKKVNLVGFKIFYNHPRDSDSEKIWEFLQGRKDIKVIHLTRENKLKTYISRKIATQTNDWKNLNGKGDLPLEKRKTTLTKAEFEEWDLWLEALKSKAINRFQSHDWIELTYESLISDQEGELNRIFSFLGVSNEKLHSPYKKQNKESLSELITNFEAFKKEIAGTEIEHYL